MEEKTNHGINGGFSSTFIKIINKYLKEEKKRRKKLEIINYQKYYYFEKIYLKSKNKEKNKNDEEELLNDIFHGERMDYDIHKYLTRNKIKDNTNNKSNKKFENIFTLRNENNKKDIVYKRRIFKSLSKNLFPTINKFNNIRILQFPQIFPEKKLCKSKTKNLLINTNSFSNISNYTNKNKNYNNKAMAFKPFLSLTGDYKKKALIPKERNKFTFYNHNLFNRTKYFNKLNLLSQKSKQIYRNLSFYSNNSRNKNKNIIQDNADNYLNKYKL